MAALGGEGSGAPGVLESVPSEFDYFASKVIQASIINEYDQDFNPASIQPGAPIEILVRGASNLYRDLNSSKLEVDLRITNADGTDIAANSFVGPANLTLHSLFSNIEMDLSKTRISDPNPLYPYRAFFETLLSYGKHVEKTRLLTEDFIKDSPAHFDDFALDGNGHNEGFKQRAAKFAGSQIVKLMGRPHLDMFHQDRDLPTSCDFLLRLIPSPNPFVLHKPGNVAENFRIQILACKLWVRTKELSPSLVLAHETMLQNHNMRIPFNKVGMKHLTIPAGVTSVEFDNVYTGVLPDRVLLAMLSDNRMNGAYTANPFLFHHFNVGHVALTVNGETIPKRAYEPNFGQRHYLREYLGTLDAIGLDIGNKMINLPPLEWADTYPFFIFRLNPGGMPTLPKTGAARLTLKFRAATPHIINAILFAESATVLEIDRYRNIILA